MTCNHMEYRNRTFNRLILQQNLIDHFKKRFTVDFFVDFLQRLIMSHAPFSLAVIFISEIPKMQ